jgi:hypothetical protein
MSSKLKTWHFLYSRLEPLVSLFEDDMYVYRDTFFVLFERGHRPAAS